MCHSARPTTRFLIKAVVSIVVAESPCQNLTSLFQPHSLALASVTKMRSRPTTNIRDRLGASCQDHCKIEVYSALSSPFGLLERLSREIREMIYIPVLARDNASSTRVRIFSSLFTLYFAPFVWPDKITVRDVYIGKTVQLISNCVCRFSGFYQTSKALYTDTRELLASHGVNRVEVAHISPGKYIRPRWQHLASDNYLTRV